MAEPAAGQAALSVRRHQELDALRALAALLVMVYHTTQSICVWWAAQPPGSGLGTIPSGWFWPLEFGQYGVNAFFIVSGNVICLTLMRQSSLAGFARARFARLFPVFWAAVIFTTLVRVGWSGDEVSWRQVAANLTMVPAWFGEVPIDGVYWTLAIELVFYGWMALIWRMGALRHLHWICVVWMLLTMVFKLMATFHPAWKPALDAVGGILLLPYAPYFSAGIVLQMMGTGLPRRQGLLIIAFAILLIAGAGVWPRTLLVGAVVLGLLVWASPSVTPRRLPTAVLYLGEASYCLYLFHQAWGYHQIGHLIHLVPSAWGLLLIVLSSCLATALLMHEWVEKPLAALMADWKRGTRR